MNRHIEREKKKRAAMNDKNVDFYVIPSADPHLENIFQITGG